MRHLLKAGAFAGALYLQSEDDPSLLAGPIDSNITGATFVNNAASSQGGAVLFRGIWAPRVTDTAFENNSVSTQTSTDGSSTGGAIFMTELEEAAAYFTRCRFTGNTAYIAGAMLITQA